MEKGGGHIIPNALIGWDPASGEDRTVALQRWQKQIIGTGPTNPLYTAMTRFPASGKVHTFPPIAGFSAPASPFPYGTIIRPTPENQSFPHSMRQMVIGPRAEADDHIVAIDLETGTAYAHLIEKIRNRWEEVPD